MNRNCASLQLSLPLDSQKDFSLTILSRALTNYSQVFEGDLLHGLRQINRRRFHDQIHHRRDQIRQRRGHGQIHRRRFHGQIHRRHFHIQIRHHREQIRQRRSPSIFVRPSVFNRDVGYRGQICLLYRSFKL